MYIFEHTVRTEARLKPREERQREKERTEDGVLRVVVPLLALNLFSLEGVSSSVG